MLLSYMIKYLPCLIVKFQAANKNLLLERCRAFNHVQPTTICMVQIFHLHHRELALPRSSFLTVTKLTNIHQPIFKIDSREKNLSKYICSVLNLFKSLVKLFRTNSIISIKPRNLHTNLLPTFILKSLNFFRGTALLNLQQNTSLGVSG